MSCNLVFDCEHSQCWGEGEIRVDWSEERHPSELGLAGPEGTAPLTWTEQKEEKVEVGLIVAVPVVFILLT